ncbi:hypothetical protein LCGC14_2613700, partial [marine sediment metagenome]
PLPPETWRRSIFGKPGAVDVEEEIMGDAVD